MKKKTIQDHKKEMRKMIMLFRMEKRDFLLYQERTLHKIKLLRSFFREGGENPGYSQAFRDAAYLEYERISQESNAINIILREDFKSKV